MIYPAILILLLNQTSATTDPVPQVVGDLLQSSCIKCHSGEEPKGGLDLEVVLEDGATAPMEDWRLVHRVLTSGEMPPEDEPSPTTPVRDAAISQLRDWMRQVLQSMPEKPGAAVTRRLGRTELHNTLRDLTGFEIDIDRHLAADPSSDGFDNQGGSLSPAYIERLFRIAEEVALGTVIIADDDSDLSILHEVDEFKFDGGGGYRQAVHTSGVAAASRSRTSFHAPAPIEFMSRVGDSRRATNMSDSAYRSERTDQIPSSSPRPGNNLAEEPLSATSRRELIESAQLSSMTTTSQNIRTHRKEIAMQPLFPSV